MVGMTFFDLFQMDLDFFGRVFFFFFWLDLTLYSRVASDSWSSCLSYPKVELQVCATTPSFSH
jgi:hypothetical protein